MIRTNNSAFSDGIIDIVGFSRGATIAREFSNDIYERVDSGYYDSLYAQQNTNSDVCSALPSIKIRF
ncbi:hypothetical protein, partial [Endozoicomonas acroporae]|uniref:hypothetical protein n=1 Tax=Endozoicomonas acroporae TaxID=1701104 RepID=UPI003D7A5916